MHINRFKDGIVVLCDSSSDEAYNTFESELGKTFQVPLIIADPPYGDIVKTDWDKAWRGKPDQLVDWMLGWTNMWSKKLMDRGAFYVWGGIGKVGFRPFFKYIVAAEKKKQFELSNLITWSKKRGYGTQKNYLFTREEAAYFIKGDAKKPLIFNKPYLDKLRGYEGYNPKYPAKDARLRRTNVWSDITEVLRGKKHVNQKADRLYEVLIETHTNPGDWVFDPFGGSGVTAHAARKLGRNFIVMEYMQGDFDKIVEALR